MLLLTVAEGVGLSYAQEQEGEEAVSLSVKAEGGSGGEVWGVHISQSLCRVTQGGSMALLLTAEASEGWRIGRVEGGEGAEGLTLTVEETPAQRVSVLLDGRVTADAEDKEHLPILRFFLEKDTQNTTERGGCVHIMAGNYGDFALYYVDAEENITAVRLVFEPHGDDGEWETSSGGGPAQTETETQTVSRPVGEETESEQSDCGGTRGEDSCHSDAVGPTEPPKAESLPNRFMGCRETVPRDGSFTVQFLFRGEGRDTPVICMKGGGRMTAEVSHEPFLDAFGESVSQTEGAWSLCTFRGLSAKGEYVFCIFTEKGVVFAYYDQGRFSGYGEVRASGR